ncbi:MAG: methylenetetrahydrofolate reductase [Spirochaetes bacterium]|jgi:methylenetetrahydrofolate reductase (NADPH)|nr:methylenetetrahydrofolate reductase [Spirochaetota bacterium]
MKSGSNLEKVLNSGKFAVTAELGPPKGADPGVIKAKAGLLKGFVDSVNITDNQTAVVRMSSLSACALVSAGGFDPVMQMVTRDRNRIALQSDVLGAVSLGIKNILCLSGDHQCFGNQPYSKGVYDIDSIQLISTLKRMRDEKKLLDSDDTLTGDIGIFIGAASTPFSEPVEYRPLRLKKKIDAGADFIQTQCIYDIELFKKFMERVVDLGLHEKCHILAGVTPLKSARMAVYMNTRVPGVIVPEKLISRMEGARKGKGSEEGIAICCELIEELRQIDGVRGVHIMAIEWEQAVGDIVKKTGLFPRPKIRG